MRLWFTPGGPRHGAGVVVSKVPAGARDTKEGAGVTSHSDPAPQPARVLWVTLGFHLLHEPALEHHGRRKRQRQHIDACPI